MLVTRFAPTPSGFLHEGNAVNAVLCSWLAQSGPDGRLLLRIDDFDSGRIRPGYLADVFDTLDWLGIRPDDGPTDPDDFAERWSMTTRTRTFALARDALLRDHPERVFVCRCSRTELVDGRCVRGCRDAGLPLQANRSVVRLYVPAGRTVPIGGADVPVPPGDHVLWRRDDLPAYHLGSVLADEELSVTAIVRGTDLLESSALQRHLAALLPAPAFLAADLRHHALLHAPDGRKLSKSAGAGAQPMPRTDGQRERILRWAEELGAPIGIAPPA